MWYRICDALRDLVPFVQFKKREKHPWKSVTDMRVLRGSARIPWMAWKILFKKYFHWNCLKIYLIFNRGVGLSMIKHETIFSGICLFYSNDVYIDNVISIYFLFIFSQYI